METPGPTAAIPSVHWRFRLATQNPFYLISAACFIHSLSFATRGATGGLAAGPRLVLICGYLSAVVVTALWLVRRWHLWDDARSLLLIVLLLFLELGLGMDVLLVREFGTGALAASGVFAVVVVASELLFRGLPLRFHAAYRLPFYLLWGAITLYPVACAAAEHAGGERLLRWTIAGFLPICSLLGLTLLRAARRGPLELYPSAHPWAWPLFPWSVFGFVLLAVALRQHALCISFDPVIGVTAEQANRLVSIFGTWMLAPAVLVIAILIHERALATASQLSRSISAALPFIAVLLALPGHRGEPVYDGFVADVTRTLGSPAWLATLACVAFQVVAWKRGNVAAPGYLALSLITGAVIGPQTLSWTSLTAPSALWLTAVVGLSAVMGVQRRSAAWLLLAGVSGATVIADWSGWQRLRVPGDEAAFNLFLIYVLGLSVALSGKDRSTVRAVAGLVLLLATVGALTSDASLAATLAYLTYLSALAATFGWLGGATAFQLLAAIDMTYVILRAGWVGYQYLWDTLNWHGLHWLAAAFAAFGIGLVISVVTKHRTRVHEAPHP